MSESTHFFPLSTSELIQKLSGELTVVRKYNAALAEELFEQRAQNAHLVAVIQDYRKETTACFPRVFSWDSIASTAVDGEEERNLVGTYTAKVREEEIQKYKAKQRRYRERVRLSREFSGRSEVAKAKPRINGKFIKTSAR